MNKVIVNCETGEQETIPLAGDELKAFLDNEAKNAAEEKAKAEAEAKAESDKAALLAKLGITSDEAKMLLS
jgi:hypothetical protein